MDKFSDERINEVIDSQAEFIKERFGEQAWANANVGWYSDAECIVTKVYGHGAVESDYETGTHTFEPFELI